MLPLFSVPSKSLNCPHGRLRRSQCCEILWPLSIAVKHNRLLACYIFQDHIEYQITMNRSNLKQVCAQAQRPLWLGVLLAVSSVAALAQTATKPQTTPTPTAGVNVRVHADETLIDSS